jgi:hypothetical protein
VRRIDEKFGDFGVRFAAIFATFAPYFHALYGAKKTLA